MIRDDSASVVTTAMPSVLIQSSPTTTSSHSMTSTSSNHSDEPDLMEVLYDKEPKSTDLQISCMICGDRASGFHYGVHACEGCKGFFRRTVRMRLKYKECQIGCKVNVKSRNKCQYCRFQKCLKSGMSHDAIRFGRMSRVEKNRIITKMAKEEPALLNRKRIEEEQKKLKQLSETILKAFHKHFSMTREKMTALWRERSLPGVSAPYLNTLEDVKVLYPQLFVGGAKNQNPNAGTAQFEPAPAQHGFDRRPNGSHEVLLPDDISFSSASSDSGSDELLSAVKKITIPYPQYENLNMTPDFPSVYQGMPAAALQSEIYGHGEFKDEPCIPSESWSAGDSSNSSQHGWNAATPPSVDNFGYEVTGRQYSNMHEQASGSDRHHIQDSPTDADMDAILYTELKAVFEPNGEEDMAVGILKKIEVGLQNKMDVDQLFEEFPGFRKFFQRLNISTEYLKKFVAEMPTYGLHSFMECARQAHVQRLLEKRLKSGSESASATTPSSTATAGKPRPFKTLLEDTNAAKSIGMQIVKFLYQNMQKRFVKGVCELTEFSKNIPGFCELTLSDQVILLKYGSYEVLFVMLGAMIFNKGMLLPEGNVYVTFDFVNKLGDVGLLMKPKFEFAEKIASMNLQDEELSLFAAAIILFGDRPGLDEREKVERVQSEILKTLEMQLKISHPTDSQLFARLLLKMTDLRQLVADHVTMVERLIKIHSIKKLFHPLIREIIKDRD